jgi:hypothetical protein
MARRKPRYKQGKFIPRNPEKYKGDPNGIIFRSGLELSYFNFFDTRKNVVAWASEEFFVPYIGPDGKRHRYFVDVYLEVKGADGTIRKFIAEIKPHSETREPRPQKRNTQAHKRRWATYMVNRCKWDAAEKFAEKNGLEFVYLTEKDLKRKR